MDKIPSCSKLANRTLSRFRQTFSDLSHVHLQMIGDHTWEGMQQISRRTDSDLSELTSVELLACLKHAVDKVAQEYAVYRVSDILEDFKRDNEDDDDDDEYDFAEDDADDIEISANKSEASSKKKKNHQVA